MRFFKILSALLALLMVVGVFASCATGGNDLSDESQNQTSIDTEAGENATQSPYDALEKENLGREFNIQVQDNRKTEFLVNDYTGDILENAIYERNSVVEDDFGITIVCTVAADYKEINENLIKQHSGGLDEYDAYMGHKYSFTTCALQNALCDMNAIVTMDLTQPYWDQACRENLVIDGRNFIMTGDVDPYSLLISSCFAFNKKMHAEMKLPNVYQLADNGEWTLDALNSMISDVTYDLNGDGSIDHENDRYGLTTWMMDVPYSLFYGAGGKFVTIDEDGLPSASFNTEQVVNIYEKIYRAIITSKSYYVTDSAYYNSTYEVFMEGRALFVDLSLNKISSTFSNMEEDYGILPVPKYDANQKEYLSFVNGASPFMMICQTEKDPEFVGTVLEAMAAYNYSHVTPKMFEIVTKLQTARDPDSSRMVDYIIRNRVYDFGYFVDLEVTNMIREKLKSKTETIASGMKSYERSSERAINKIIEQLSKFS